MNTIFFSQIPNTGRGLSTAYFQSSSKVRVAPSAFSLHVFRIMFLYHLQRYILARLISSGGSFQTRVLSLARAAAALLSKVTLGESLGQQLQVPRYLDGPKQVIVTISC